MNNDKVIAPGMFRINPDKTSREEKNVPNIVRASNINDLVSGLPKFKYNKEHLCPSCEQGKSKRASHPPKPVSNSRQRLHLLHMDLCGPLRIASINGKWVYFVEGLGHNLFSVGRFCDSDLEVAFRRNACFVRNLDGVDLLKGDRLTNLYTINLHEMASASPICLMARATSTKSWLWH
nr:integrase, catalytic region, zinc finger, CCHC-type, peptidase aspartic, catalytic [Tanacetum cinerariifolium]